jgi:hypothetical protein
MLAFYVHDSSIYKMVKDTKFDENRMSGCKRIEGLLVVETRQSPVAY